MAKKFQAVHVVKPASYELPAPMCREIGRVFVRWAYFEKFLRDFAWKLADVDDKLGRVAIREPREKEQLEMIRDIAALKEIEIDEKILKSLIAKVENISSRRDIIAHGTWTETRYGWSVQRTGGQWPKQLPVPDPPTGSRRITPEGMVMDVSTLRALWADIEKLIDLAKDLRASARERPQS